MDLFLALGVFTVIFILLYALFGSGGTQAEQQREVVRRLTRPDEIEVSITGKPRPSREGILAALYSFNVLRRLEEMMWQAGLYMRVGDVLLIMVLMFGAGMLL